MVEFEESASNPMGNHQHLLKVRVGVGGLACSRARGAMGGCTNEAYERA